MVPNDDESTWLHRADGRVLKAQEQRRGAQAQALFAARMAMIYAHGETEQAEDLLAFARDSQTAASRDAALGHRATSGADRLMSSASEATSASNAATTSTATMASAVTAATNAIVKLASTIGTIGTFESMASSAKLAARATALRVGMSQVTDMAEAVSNQALDAASTAAGTGMGAANEQAQTLRAGLDELQTLLVALRTRASKREDESEASMSTRLHTEAAAVAEHAKAVVSVDAGEAAWSTLIDFSNAGLVVSQPTDDPSVVTLVVSRRVAPVGDGMPEVEEYRAYVVADAEVPGFDLDAALLPSSVYYPSAAGEDGFVRWRLSLADDLAPRDAGSPWIVPAPTKDAAPGTHVGLYDWRGVPVTVGTPYRVVVLTRRRRTAPHETHGSALSHASSAIVLQRAMGTPSQPAITRSNQQVRVECSVNPADLARMRDVAELRLFLVRDEDPSDSLERAGFLWNASIADRVVAGCYLAVALDDARTYSFTLPATVLDIYARPPIPGMHYRVYVLATTKDATADQRGAWAPALSEASEEFAFEG